MMQVYIIGKEKDEFRLSLTPPVDKSMDQASGNKERGINLVSRPGNTLKFNPSKIIPTRLNQKKEVGALKDGYFLLNMLKTGMELEGTITSCTPYAVFVDAGVMRAGKGGSFVPVNGMLHQNDMPPGTKIRSSNNRRNKNREVVEEENDGMMLKGKSIRVYVKEVYKNSGRITFSLNPNIKKSEILAEKEKTKADGIERRRARRMRRILEDIAVGDTITGTVDRVISEGVLINIHIEGASLPIMGLISKRDLPKQFAVPPDIKDSFQKQLLEQDFAPGREVTCGVYRINNKSNERMKYNLKLAFEDFGPLPEEDINIPDSAIEAWESGANDDNDGTALEIDNDSADITLSVDDEEDAWEDADLREIYGELRGNKPWWLSLMFLIGLMCKTWLKIKLYLYNRLMRLSKRYQVATPVTPSCPLRNLQKWCQ